MAAQPICSDQIGERVKEYVKTHLHEIEQALGGPTSGPNKLCWECGGKGHTRREHWRAYRRFKKDKASKEQVAQGPDEKEQARKIIDSNTPVKPTNFNLEIDISAQQGGGDYICS